MAQTISKFRLWYANLIVYQLFTSIVKSIFSVNENSKTCLAERNLQVGSLSHFNLCESAFHKLQEVRLRSFVGLAFVLTDNYLIFLTYNQLSSHRRRNFLRNFRVFLIITHKYLPTFYFRDLTSNLRALNLAKTKTKLNQYIRKN